LLAPERGTPLLELAEHDARSRPARAAREWQAAEHRVEQGRLAAPVRPDECQPVAPADLEVDRPKREGAAFDNGRFEAHDDLAAARRRREPESQLPRLVRLVDALQVGELLLERLLDVLRLLLLAALAVSALLPLLHPPRLCLDPLLLGDVPLPA